MEKMYFDFAQPKVQISGGMALVLLNEEKQEQTHTIPAGEDGEEETAETITQWVYDGVWLPNCASEDKVVDAAKAYVEAEITDYDQSENVNQLSVNGIGVWFGPEERAKIKQGVESCKSTGRETYDVAWNGLQISIACDNALTILAQIEVYALDCLNVTAKHKAAVEALTEMEDVLAYDYTTGYPEKLSFSF